MAVFFAKAYDARLGYSGLSLGYQFGTILGSAFAPIIAAKLLLSTGTISSVGVYMVVAAVISVLCAVKLTEAKQSRPVAMSSSGSDTAVDATSSQPDLV